MLLGRAGLSPVMVGREAELGRLLALRPGPDPEVAFVGGEAGVGKTRLVVHELARRAGDGALIGGASNDAATRPYSVLHEAIEPAVSRWTALPDALRPSATAIRTLLGPLARHLAPEPPELGAVAPPSPTPDELARGAVELIRHLAPTLLVFDDLHWADAESVTLFGRLATTPGLATLLVATYRPEELGARHPLAALMVDLERRRSVTHLTLGRLDSGQVGELLAHVYRRMVPFVVTETLHRRTAGNPFFVEELVLAAGDAAPEELDSLPLPWTLTETVLRHLDGLPPEVLRVVDAAAVLRRRIPFDLLAAMTGLGEDDLIDVLRLLVERGLLSEIEPDVFTFRHALTHEAVEARLLGRERRRLHDKAYSLLVESGSDDWTSIARHALDAGRWDDMVEAARTGARANLSDVCGSPASAILLAELGLSEAEDDIELHAIATRGAWMVGALGTALRHGERWRVLASGADDVREELTALVVLARVSWEANDEADSWEAIRQALALAESIGPSPELALATSLVSEAHMLMLDPAAAIEWADRSLAVSEEVGCRDHRARALVNKGTALTDMPGRRVEGMAVLEEAIAEARAAKDDFSLGRGYHNLLKVRMRRQPLARSWADLAEERAHAERSGRSGNSRSLIEMTAAELAELDGDLVGARAHIGEARRHRPDVLEGRHRGWFAAMEGALALERGDVEAAADWVARRRAEPDDNLGEVVWVAADAGVLAARRGDLATLREELATVLGVTTLSCWGVHVQDPLLKVLTAALAAGIAPAEVRAQLEGRAPSDVWSVEPDPALDAHVEAALLAAEGAHDAAIAQWRIAVDPAGLNRPAWLRAEAHLGLARSLQATGDRDAALVQVDEAARLLERWPGWRADEAAAYRRRLTRASAPVDEGPGAGGLTPREREVATLVAQGASNGDIGRALFISTKTASVHVSNILLKLGLSNRAEVAAWAVRNGLEA